MNCRYSLALFGIGRADFAFDRDLFFDFDLISSIVSGLRSWVKREGTPGELVRFTGLRFFGTKGSRPSFTRSRPASGRPRVIDLSVIDYWGMLSDILIFMMLMIPPIESIREQTLQTRFGARPARPSPKTTNQ